MRRYSHAHAQLDALFHVLFISTCARVFHNHVSHSRTCCHDHVTRAHVFSRSRINTRLRVKVLACFPHSRITHAHVSHLHVLSRANKRTCHGHTGHVTLHHVTTVSDQPYQLSTRLYKYYSIRYHYCISITVVLYYYISIYSSVWYCMKGSYW